MRFGDRVLVSSLGNKTLYDLFVILSPVSDMQVSFIRYFLSGSGAETAVHQLRLICFYSELSDCYSVRFSIQSFNVVFNSLRH